MRKALVLDPAASTGYCLVEINGDKGTIYEYGFIEIRDDTDFDGDRCIDMMQQVKKLIEDHDVTEIAHEDYFFSKRFAQGGTLNVALRTAIQIQARQLGLDYTILNVSNWKKFIANRSTPTKEQKALWGKEPAKKLMIQQALWDKWGYRFPNHSISKKTGKPIKFRYDVVDAVGQAVFFCRLHLNLTEVELSVTPPEDVELKTKSKAQFKYPED
jgi:Holliday junction resolvasome RuvABC endonuclease subunit